MTDGADGEPRVGMLETIREYALERLEQAGELDDARRRHAQYYAAFAERAHGQLRGRAHLAALDGLEAEHENLRAALAWSLETPAAGSAPADRERAATGLQLVQALALFWFRHGHATEGRRWLHRAIELASDDAGAPLAKVAHWLGMLLQQQSEFDAALRLFERSLAIWRDLSDRPEEARELNSLGFTYRKLGDLDTARSLLEDSIAITREHGTSARLAKTLMNLGQAESDAGNFDRASQLLQEALALSHKQGDMQDVAINQLTLALISLRLGRAREARDQLAAALGYAVSSGDTEFLLDALEMSAAVAANLGEGLRAARFIGAAQAIREKAGMPGAQSDQALLEQLLASARDTIALSAWDAELAAGRALTQQQAAALLVSPSPAHDTLQ